MDDLVKVEDRRLTRWLVRWTAVLSLTTICMAVVSYFQWEELRNADETARQALLVSTNQLLAMQGQLAEIKSASIDTKRTIAAFEKLADAAVTANRFNPPVATVESIEAVSPLNLEGDPQIGLKFKMKNPGRNFVENVYLLPILYFQGETQSRDEIIAEQKKVCDGAREGAKSSTGVRHAILSPSEPISESVYLRVPRAEAEKKAWHTGYGISATTFYKPFVVGCIEYRSEEKRRYTKFLGEILLSDNSSIDPARIRYLRADQFVVQFYVNETN